MAFPALTMTRAATSLFSFWWCGGRRAFCCNSRTFKATAAEAALGATRCRRGIADLYKQDASGVPPTAAMCVIGDEILSGSTADTNTNYLARLLFDSGITLRRVEIVPDEMDDVVDSLRRLTSFNTNAAHKPRHHREQQHCYDLVFTSGGIGPTHDDITYEAVAQALELELELHIPTAQRMAALLQRPARPISTAASIDASEFMAQLSKPQLRMATLPSPSRVIFEEYDETQLKTGVLEKKKPPPTWVPVCCVGNLRVLPGVPLLFKRLAHAAVADFWACREQEHRLLQPQTQQPQDADGALALGSAPKINRKRGLSRGVVAMRAGLKESEIADRLRAVQVACAGRGVRIGSYPGITELLLQPQTSSSSSSSSEEEEEEEKKNAGAAGYAWRPIRVVASGSDAEAVRDTIRVLALEFPGSTIVEDVPS